MRASSIARVRRYSRHEWAVMLPVYRDRPSDRHNLYIFEIHDNRREAELCAQTIVAVRNGKATATDLAEYVR
jgi:hypothetical protein